MNFRRSLGLISTAIISMSIAHHAKAQNVDYGSLEQMFGAPVTTSATGSPQLASQAPADMQIITADDIRRSGATNIPDILRFVPGLDVRTYGSIDADISTGGFSQVSNPQLLVLINGRQVYSDDYGSTFWQNLPVQLADIRQIEIVQGPASALFGFNAANGVINIITYDPLTDHTDSATVGFGTDGLLTGSLVSTLQEPGKGGVTVSLGGLKSNEYSTDNLPASAAPYYDKPHEANYAIDARAKPTASTEATLEITQSASQALEQSPVYIPTEYSFRISSIKLGFTADSPWGLMTLQAYMNRSLGNTQLAVLSAPPTDTNNQVGVVQANDLFKIGNNSTVRLGLEYRSNRETGNAYNTASTYQDYAASAMWTWQITPQLSLTNAGRLDRLVVHRGDPLAPGNPFTQADYSKAQFTAPSFNAGLVYQPANNGTLRLLIGHGVQAPSQVDFGLTTHDPLGPIFDVEAGNPYLKPSTTTQYEFDYDRDLPELQSSVHTAVFYSVVKDILLSSVNTPFTIEFPNVISYAQNIGNGQSIGGRISLQGSNAAGWRWNLAYSLIAVRAHLIYAPPSVPFAFNNATPTSAIDFGIGYSWNKLEADLQGKWQSRYTDYYRHVTAFGEVYLPVAIANFVTVDARIGYNLTPQLTLAVSGQQLQGNQTLETAGPKPDRRILFSATYGF
jgi:outer membrane receptor for ferrienterochelin and colicins